MLRKTGKWAVPWLAALMVFGAAQVGNVPNAEAALVWYDWSAGPSQMVGSLIDGIDLGRDIDAAYYAFDADYRFFRLDLKGAPEMGSNNYAPLYQFAIGTPGGTGYLNTLAMPISFPPPTTLSFFSGAAPPSMFSEFHFRFKTPSVLEWAVKKEDLPDYFAWYALTGDLSGGSISGIFDMTAPALATPIPSAAWLLGSGVIALIGLRRRKVTGYSFS